MQDAEEVVVITGENDQLSIGEHVSAKEYEEAMFGEPHGGNITLEGLYRVPHVWCSPRMNPPTCALKRVPDFVPRRFDVPFDVFERHFVLCCFGFRHIH